MISQKYWAAWLLLLSGFLVPAVQGISLTSQSIGTIVYQPGLNTSYYLTVGDAGGEITAEVSGPAELQNYVTVSEVILNEFYLKINFPTDVYVTPGYYDLAITVKEKPLEAAGGFSTLTAVSKKFYIQVYTSEKDVEVGLEVPNVNENDPIPAGLIVHSVTYSNIDAVYGVISVFNENKSSVATMTTSTKSLPSLETVKWKESITRKLPLGDYVVKAVVFYDGKREETNVSFLVGNMDVMVKDHTSTFLPGFNEFQVKLLNNWGKALNNVYVLLAVNGTDLVQTPSIRLEPWRPGIVQAIVKVDFNPGTYPGELRIFFEGASKSVPVTITVTALPALPALSPLPEEERLIQRPWSSAVILSAIGVVLVAIILIIIYLFLKMRRNKKEIMVNKDEF